LRSSRRCCSRSGTCSSPAVKAALLGAAAGILFGFHGALVKGMVEQFDNGVLGPLESRELYAVIVGALISVTVRQISFEPGDLPPAMATQSIAAPVVGVVFGVILFGETLHDSAAGWPCRSSRSP
jgi:drug/metabolite transporter (DMT)-like permease